MKDLKVTSPVFNNNEYIPLKYTCDGEDINPPIDIKDLPETSEGLVLIVDDPDAPRGTWDHWIVWNIPLLSRIDEDSIPGVQGINDFKRHDYGGPCPPYGTHRYFFKVYALDTKLNLNPNSKKKNVENAMKDHILSKGQIIGLYQRK
jgi:Raf kinase inhibitor-like YbhB/YbcL family protein